MSEVDKSRIESLLLSGKKIEAIKEYREATNLGLKESKDAVEVIEAELISQGRLQKKASGCLGLMMLLTSLIVLVLLIVLD